MAIFIPTIMCLLPMEYANKAYLDLMVNPFFISLTHFSPLFYFLYEHETLKKNVIFCFLLNTPAKFVLVQQKAFKKPGYSATAAYIHMCVNLKTTMYLLVFTPRVSMTN